MNAVALSLVPQRRTMHYPDIGIAVTHNASQQCHIQILPTAMLYYESLQCHYPIRAIICFPTKAPVKRVMHHGYNLKCYKLVVAWLLSCHMEIWAQLPQEALSLQLSGFLWQLCPYLTCGTRGHDTTSLVPRFLTGHETMLQLLLIAWCVGG